jgi:hypothetical protein
MWREDKASRIINLCYKWLASFSCRLTVYDIALHIHLIGIWLNPRTGLDVVAKIEISDAVWNRTPRFDISITELLFNLS